MIPHLFGNNLDIFNNYLSKSNVYLEFGSGGSTYVAAHTHKIPVIHYVESDRSWFERVKKECPNAHGHFIDIKSKPNSCGNPGTNASIESMKKYSDVYIDDVDTILLDGRFRVACALKLHSKISGDCVILFDDFLNRPQYHIVLDYYDIIKKGSQLVVLKKKNNAVVCDNVIKKYETVKD